MNKALGFIGLLYRGGKVSIGDNVFLKEAHSHPKLVIIATDASELTKNKIKHKAEFYHVEVMEMFTVEELASSIGRNQISFLGINDKSAALSFKSKL